MKHRGAISGLDCMAGLDHPDAANNNPSTDGGSITMHSKAISGIGISIYLRLLVR